jgi:hypothetical protein
LSFTIVLLDDLPPLEEDGKIACIDPLSSPTRSVWLSGATVSELIFAPGTTIVSAGSIRFAKLQKLTVPSDAAVTKPDLSSFGIKFQIRNQKQKKQ